MSSSYFYLDAPAGSGKTCALVRHAKMLADGRDNVLFVQPTKKLIERTIEEHIKNSSTMTVYVSIYTEEFAKTRPVLEIQSLLESGFPEGGILFITHEAFLRLQWQGHLTDWHLIVDEVPTAFKCFEHTVPETHKILTDRISPMASDIEGHPFAVVSDGTEIRKMARNKDGDEVWATFRDVATVLDSPKWLTYLHQENFDAVRRGPASKLLLFSLLKPSICERFSSVVMAAANFKDSLLFKLWCRQGAKFVEHPYLLKELRFHRHENGGLITFNYAGDVRWTKTGKYNDLKGIDYSSLMDLVVRKLRNHLGETEFLWVANKDDPDTLFDGLKGRRLPNVPHGLNEFQSYNCVVFLSALRLSSSNRAWFEAMGISEDEVDDGLHMETAYQAIARSSLRSGNSLDLVEVFVPDLETAKWLQEKFPGSKLNNLNWVPNSLIQKKKSGRPKKHASDADRKKYHDAKTVIDKALRSTRELLDNPSATLDIIRTLPTPDFIGDETTLIDDNNVGKLYYGMQFISKRISSPKAVVIERSADRYVEILLKNREEHHPTKGCNSLISPSVYNLDKIDKGRKTKKNIEFCSGIWIDVDRGNVHPEEIASSISDLCFYAFNSFRSKAGDFRSHLYFPTATIMSLEGYELITKRLFQRMEAAGFLGCIDDGKLHSASLFYMPCQAEDPTGNFFFSFIGGKRAELDPEKCLREALDDHIGRAKPDWMLPFTESPTFALDCSFRNQAIVDAAIRRWTEEGWKAGKGNDEFFKLALQLVRAGLDDFEIKNLLWNAAATANTPADRRDSTDRLIARVRGYGRSVLAN